MNWAHLRAIFWLRWRGLNNRLRRTGKVGKFLSALLGLLVALVSVSCFVLTLVIGFKELPEAEPFHLMLAWVVIAGTFLFFWMVGLVTDLQRSDAMSVRNFQHLPISLGWIFAYNYASSFVSWSMALFLPTMLALCIAMLSVHGWWMMPAFLLVIAFLGLVTALTYQLRGWLARLMEDKRRGRNVVAIITLAFVVLVQLPNLLQLGGDRTRNAKREAVRALVDAKEDEAAAIEGAAERAQAARDTLARLDVEEEASEERIALWLTRSTQFVPFGWLPYGVRALAERRLLPAVLCAAGMLLLTGLSLRRSYRTAVALARGAVDTAPLLRVPEAGPTKRAPGRPTRSLIDRQVPFTSDRVAAICCANLRSLLRAPEFKLVLLGQVVLLGLLGLMFRSGGSLSHLQVAAHWLGLGASALVLLGLLQLTQNQFGWDRSGFRAYVLCPVPRHEILRAKNLSLAPFGLGTGVIALTGLQWLRPSDAAHFAGMLLQMVSAYLLLCLVGNLISILGPMRLQAHGMRASDAKLKNVLWQLCSMVLCPIVLSPLLLPSLAEFLLLGQSWAQGLPIFLLGHLLLTSAVFAAYLLGTRYQGELLQEREQGMLEILTRQAT